MSTDSDTAPDVRSIVNETTSNSDDHPFTTIEQIRGFDWSGFPLESLEHETTKPYANPSILAYLYWLEDYTQAEIGERYDVTSRTIGYWMRQLDIPTEADPSIHRASLVYANECQEDKYDWIWSCSNGERYNVYAHLLVACLDNDPHEVFADGVDVHHATGHPLDNRPDTLEVRDHDEHLSLEQSGEWVIEDGEPRLRHDPDDDAVNPVTEWWGDPVDGDDGQ
jgi:hypothetical protein